MIADPLHLRHLLVGPISGLSRVCWHASHFSAPGPRFVIVAIVLLLALIPAVACVNAIFGGAVSRRIAPLKTRLVVHRFDGAWNHAITHEMVVAGPLALSNKLHLRGPPSL